MYFTCLSRFIKAPKILSIKQAKIVKYSSYTTSDRRVSTDKPLVLYGDEASPLVRFVLMSASLLEINLKFKHVDLFLGEQFSENYKKINFLQKIPSLEVNNVVIKDSHAIAILFCKLSEKGHLLYPDEPIKRALIHQFLFFNSSTLFQLDSAVFTQYFMGNWPIDEKKFEEWNKLLDFLETILTENQWLTGNNVMLCDLGCAATISSLQLLIPASSRHTKINEWLKRLQELPCYDVNKKGLERLNYFVKASKSN